MVGCGPVDDGLPKTVSATGTITLDGSPVEGASIVFIDVSGTYSASASSDSKGYFSLNSFEAKSGAVPASYKVQVSKTVEIEGAGQASARAPSEEAEHAAESEEAGIFWKNDLPKKYASIATSGLAFDITEDGADNLDISLTSK